MSNDGYSAAQVREALNRNDLNALRDAGLLKPGEIDLLLSFERHIEDAQENDLYQQIMRRSMSQNLREAVKNGNVSQMQYATGIVGHNDSKDASAFRFLDTVEELFEPEDRDHMLNLVAYAPPPPIGPTGVGKTDAMYTIIEGAQRVHPSGVEVASNNVTDPFPDVQRWTELEQWLENTDGTKIFLWDEASQVLMFDDLDAGKALSNLIKLLRKHNCHLLLVGHTGKDIPKDVRRMVLFMLKEKKEKAVIGAGLEEDNAGWMQIKNVLHRTHNLPPTTITYESIDDKGSFTFDKENGSEGAEEAEEYHQCDATTNSGSRCRKEARYPRGMDKPRYCGLHRSRLEDAENEE